MTTFLDAQDSTNKCIPVAEYVHILKYAETGLVCDSIVIEKDIQLGAAGEVIIGQSVEIEKKDKRIKRLWWVIKGLGVAVLVEGIVIILK